MPLGDSLVSQWNELTPDELDAFDPDLLLGCNPDVHFVMVVGEG